MTPANTTTAENTTFTIDVPADFNGKVNITIGNITRTLDVAGPTQIVFDKLDEGEKTANLSFYGDNNYNPETREAKFNITKVYVIDPENPVLPDIPGLVGNLTGNITTIKTDNMTRGYNSEFDYEAVFLDM